MFRFSLPAIMFNRVSSTSRRLLHWTKNKYWLVGQGDEAKAESKKESLVLEPIYHYLFPLKTFKLKVGKVIFL